MMVTFSIDEVAELRGRLDRVLTEDKWNRTSTLRDASKTNEDADWIGLLGEYAVAKSFRMTMADCDILKKGKSPNLGYDLRLPDARTVQVKSVYQRCANTTHDFLFALEGDDPIEFSSDVGVLCLVQPNYMSVRLAGYITREEFWVTYRILDLGTGNRACVSVRQMHPCGRVGRDE